MKRKKWITFMVALGLILCMFAAPAALAAGITLDVNGKVLKNIVEPGYVAGTVLVTPEQAEEALAASLTWNETAKTVTAIRGDKAVVLTLDQSMATVQSSGSEAQTAALDQPAQIINGKVMVPIRFLTVQFGGKVEWAPKTKSVKITIANLDGSSPLKGEKGDQGDKGDKGDSGATGPAGPAGATGSAGPAGATGPAGPAGATGPAGPAGATGPAGPAGATGPAGPIGLTGPAGPAGGSSPEPLLGTTFNEVGSGGNVVFNNLLFSMGNISYNNLTGVVTLNQTGTYRISWTVSTDGLIDVAANEHPAITFAVSSSQGDFVRASSLATTGQTSGSTVIGVDVTPVTLSLVNGSGYKVNLPNIPVQASILITRLSTPDIFLYIEKTPVS